MEPALPVDQAREEGDPFLLQQAAPSLRVVVAEIGPGMLAHLITYLAKPPGRVTSWLWTRDFIVTAA